MKKNRTYKKSRSIICTIFGFFLLVVGAIIGKETRGVEGFMEVLPYISIGIGAGIFGQNSGELIKRASLKNSPEEAKRLEIEAKDERNMALEAKAKAKAYELMIFVFGALMLAFGLMEVDMIVVISMVIAYLFVAGSSIYFRFQYEKEM